MRLPKPLAERITTREQRSRACHLDLVQFGAAVPKAVDAAVDRTSDLAGLPRRFDVPITQERLDAFPGSDAARSLGVASSDPTALGAALARYLVDGRPAGDPVVTALFGDGVSFPALDHVVVTQREGLRGDGTAIAAGFAQELWRLRIPVGYVEALDVRGSGVRGFRALDVPTVDGVEDGGGARDLAAILVEEVQAHFGSSAGASVGRTARGDLVDVDRTAATVDAVARAGTGGPSPWLVLAGLGLAVACWAGVGVRLARARR